MSRSRSDLTMFLMMLQRKRVAYGVAESPGEAVVTPAEEVQLTGRLITFI